MEIPIVNNPEILDELISKYRSAFPEIRQGAQGEEAGN